MSATGQRRIAIAVLAKGYSCLSQYSSLVLRNLCVFNALETQSLSSQDCAYSIDHIIFHEGNITLAHRLAISICAFPHRLVFRDIRQFFADCTTSVTASSGWCYETALSRQFAAGYKAMCRFWFDGFLQFLDHYDYVVRVDDDCYLESFPLVSVIEEIERGDAEYVTAILTPRDDESVTVGLPQFASWFLGTRPTLREPSFDRNPYTNFFVLNAKYFSSNPDFLGFASAVHSSCCISINRWGDMPLWGVILSMLAKPGVLSVRSDIRYYHGSHMCPVNLPEGGRLAATEHPLRWQIFLFLDSISRKYSWRNALSRLSAFCSVLLKPWNWPR